MDTTQTNREEAARRSRPEVPQSAQQRNGAARTPEEQRSAAARQRQTPPESGTASSGQAAPRQKIPASEQKQAARKRPAGEKKQAAQKRPAPEQKQAARKRPAAEQKQAAQKQTAPAKKRPSQPAPKQKQAAPKQSASKQAGLPDSVSNKKRAYGNSKPKKKSAFAVLMGNVAKVAAQKQEDKAKRAARKKPKKRPSQPTPAVIYTQPQAFNRNRLFVQLLTVMAVVVALVLGLSVFFKVETITVTGAEVYSAWTIREASGISEGDNLLTFSHARAGARIKANLPYVNTVRFGIKLPDTVNIIIEEDDVVYAIKDANSQWWLVNSGGRVVEQCSSGKATNYTQILGVTLESPAANERAAATENAPTETDPETHELVPVTTSGAQRLTAALEIVRALEDNDIVGSAASVDVSSLEDIVLWYGTRYQVNLGDDSQLTYKVTCMNDVILQLSDFQSGILDISFTIWPDRVIYTPFG